MKVGAHPMVVAVALGLLGPNALAAEREAEASCEGDRPERPKARCGEVCACFDGEVAPVSDDRDPLDVAAVEAAWTEMVR